MNARTAKALAPTVLKGDTACGDYSNCLQLKLLQAFFPRMQRLNHRIFSRIVGLDCKILHSAPKLF